MTRYLLDTNVLISLLRHGSRSPVADRMRRHAGAITTSMLAAEEIYRGAWRSARPDTNLEAVEALLAAVPPLDFGRDDAREAGRIDGSLARAGRRIGPFDTLIAAQAVVRRLTLVTHNTHEFSRIEGLVLVDWETPEA